jgi:hypothetical protein
LDQLESKIADAAGRSYAVIRGRQIEYAREQARGKSRGVEI